jgi:beta-1,4-N-acetylglucosaminyltransferase
MKRKGKIAFAASAGGHLTEINMIFTSDLIGDVETIILTEETERTKNLKDKTYFFKQMGYNPFLYFSALLKCLKIFKREKVRLVITNGAEVGLPSMVAARLLGIKSVFIEIAGNVKTPSLYGKTIYPFANVFLTQTEELARRHGKKAKYVGGII